MTSYCQVINFLLIKHGINEIIAEADMDILNFKQATGQIGVEHRILGQKPYSAGKFTRNNLSMERLLKDQDSRFDKAFNVFLFKVFVK